MFKILFICSLFLIGSMNVKAYKSSAENSCEYTGTSSSGEKMSVTCDFYANNSYDCSFSNSKENSNSEGISNWGSIVGGGFNAKDYYAKNKKCIPYMVFVDTGAAINGYELYAADTYTTATTIAADRNKIDGTQTVINESKNVSTTDTDKVNSYIDMLSNIGDTFELDDYCEKENGGYYIDMSKTTYQLCRDSMQSLYTKINEWDKIIQDLIDKGELSLNDPLVQEYYKARSKARGALSTDFDKNWIEDSDSHIVPSAPSAPTEGCEILGGVNSDTVKMLSNAIKIIRLGAPILIIILGITDFLKILFSGEEKDFKESFNKFVKRLIAGVILIFIPYILQLIVSLSGVEAQYGIDNFFCSIIK